VKPVPIAIAMQGSEMASQNPVWVALLRAL
jgi:hypothetical protein